MNKRPFRAKKDVQNYFGRDGLNRLFYRSFIDMVQNLTTLPSINKLFTLTCSVCNCSTPLLRKFLKPMMNSLVNLAARSRTFCMLMHRFSLNKVVNVWLAGFCVLFLPMPCYVLCFVTRKTSITEIRFLLV